MRRDRVFGACVDSSCKYPEPNSNTLTRRVSLLVCPLQPHNAPRGFGSRRAWSSHGMHHQGGALYALNAIIVSIEHTKFLDNRAEVSGTLSIPAHYCFIEGHFKSRSLSRLTLPGVLGRFGGAAGMGWGRRDVAPRAFSLHDSTSCVLPMPCALTRASDLGRLRIRCSQTHT